MLSHRAGHTAGLPKGPRRRCLRGLSDETTTAADAWTYRSSSDAARWYLSSCISFRVSICWLGAIVRMLFFPVDESYRTKFLLREFVATAVLYLLIVIYMYGPAVA